jgi:prolyl-tRNA synthetase
MSNPIHSKSQPKEKTAITAITPTREDDYPEWYQQVVKAAEMAENSPVRGCMVIKPWGYGVWENMQRYLDDRIKETGHENAYFPLFIPLSFLEKEAAHVEGFAKECAVVTHHRLAVENGKLVPAGELEEPLVVRPTSEAIIGDSFSRWVSSYRDLPLLINQWANVVRWEMRCRLFLRTAEFLWQEGHTAHATEKEAHEHSLKMLEVYREFVENVLAIPVIPGEKSEGERFPGAENTYTIEAMMQDRKALQLGTSHYLGQNFSKAFGIKFNNINGELEHAYTTSWGVTTRMIGALVMVHGDDDGMRLPPRISPKHAVIIPVLPGSDAEGKVRPFVEKLERSLAGVEYHGRKLAVSADWRDLRGGEKGWGWIKKGIPLRIECGPRDVEEGSVMVMRRDRGPKEKIKIKFEDLSVMLPQILDEMQRGYYERAKAFTDANIRTDIQTLDQMKEYFTPKNPERPEIHGGFVLAKWCGDKATEAMLEEMKLTIRCLPLKQSGTVGKCLLTGNEATLDAIFAKSY